MNITVVVGSPKKRFSTSMYFSKIVKLFLIGHTVKIIHLVSVNDYSEIIAQLPKTDALVFAFPIYVDAIPSTLLDYLQKLQKDISEKKYAFKVYGINACGFYEGHQCHLTLDMLKNWCARTNLEWGGGIGIGAGEMLSIIRIMIPIRITITLFIQAISQVLQNEYLFSPDTLITALSSSIIGSAVVYTLFSLGMFVGLFRMKTHIVKKETYKNIFTTVWFCPRFLFVFFASIYWVLRALICHLVPVWRLFRKIDVAEKNIRI